MSTSIMITYCCELKICAHSFIVLNQSLAMNEPKLQHFLGIVNSGKLEA